MINARKRASTPMRAPAAKKSPAIPLDPRTKATVTIQNVWRRSFQHNTTARLIERQLAVGPTIEHVKSISFEALVVLLREKPVIGASKALLQRIHLLSTFRHGSPSKALSPENVNVRVFLAGFMIAYRPTHVFEAMGTLEQALYESATPLIVAFEKIRDSLRRAKGNFAQVRHELTKDFPTLLFEFLKRFKAWKVPDEAKLTSRIKHALIALYQAEEHLPPDEPEDSKLKIEFRTQIERLRSKLQQIAGVDALNQFDERRRSSPSPCSGAAPHPPHGFDGGAYAALPGRMTNEQLAHELLLDCTFQLDESGGCSVENPVFHRIRESFHQAFWDSLVDDLKLAVPCYVRVLRVLGEIRDGINDLAGSRESGSITEAVDLGFIREQAEAGLYGWGSCMGLIAAIVKVVQKVQAPKRDEETKAKWTEVGAQMQAADADAQARPRSLCKALEFLLDRVNAMRIDAANARLRLIAPVIKDHGVDYERGKFQDKLDDGTLTLERTRAWVRKALRWEVQSGLPLDDLLEGKPQAFVRVHLAAVLDLVVAPAAPKADACPETLLMDAYRLGQFGREFGYIAEATTMTFAVINATPAPLDKASVASSLKAFFMDEDKKAIDWLEVIVCCFCGVFFFFADLVWPGGICGAQGRPPGECSDHRGSPAVLGARGRRAQALVGDFCFCFGRFVGMADVRLWQREAPARGRVRLPVQGEGWRRDCGDVRKLHWGSFREGVFFFYIFWCLPLPDVWCVQFVEKLRTLVDVNRLVHLPTYNRLIGEEALAFKNGL